MADVAVGSDLDCQVALSVFGWRIIDDDEIGSWLKIPDDDPTRFWPMHAFGSADTAPRYSAEMRHAWLVVERLRARGVEVMIFQGEHRDLPAELLERADRQWECALWWQENGEHRETTQYADTAAEAICRAALQAFPSAPA